MRLRTLLERLKTGMKDPHMRANMLALAGGKAIGLTLLLTAMYIAIPPALHAQAAPAGPSPEVNALNTVWVLLAAFLVFCMQVGFVMLEAGFARSRESINILVEGIVDTCICGVTFWAWGFAFMFEPGNGFIGQTGFFLKGIPDTYLATGVPLLAFWVFQFAFADTCSTITSGAMVGRCGFIGDILYSIGVTGFIYPIIGHWAWGPDGWLVTMSTPFHDFAGSTVVHSIGGAISLAGAIVLGPRLGRRFLRDGGGPMLPHNIILGAVGGLILWFGLVRLQPWQHAVGDGRSGHLPRLLQHDDGGMLCGSHGPVLRLRARRQMGSGYHDERIPGRTRGDHLPLLLGLPTGAFFIGMVAGVVVIWAIDALEYLRIDDPIGAVPVHLVCGIWGTLSLGLFATGAYGAPTPTGADTSAAVLVKGLFYGGGMSQLIAQGIGSGAVVLSTLVVAFVLMYAVNATGTLRVSRAGEIEGLDLHEHGMVAYPEYVIHGYEPSIMHGASSSHQ